MQEKGSTYLLCFYHIRQGTHLNYHHVLIPAKLVKDEKALERMEGDGYMYYLVSQIPVLLTEPESKSTINRPLIMDGESLWKRIKKNFNKTVNKTPSQ